MMYGKLKLISRVSLKDLSTKLIPRECSFFSCSLLSGLRKLWLEPPTHHSISPPLPIPHPNDHPLITTSPIPTTSIPHPTHHPSTTTHYHPITPPLPIPQPTHHPPITNTLSSHQPQPPPTTHTPLLPIVIMRHQDFHLQNVARNHASLPTLFIFTGASLIPGDTISDVKYLLQIYSLIFVMSPIIV